MNSVTALTLLPALRLGAPHGLQGGLRAVVMLAAPQLVIGQPLTTRAMDGSAGPALTVTELQLQPGGHARVQLAGITDRTAAEALNGLTLLLPREQLPPPTPDEIYLGDLLGREVAECGQITGLHEAAGQDLLEITLMDGRKKLIPVNAEFFTDLHAAPLVLSDLGRQLIEL